MPPHRRYVAPWLPILGLWAEWPGPLPLVESEDNEDGLAKDEAGPVRVRPGKDQGDARTGEVEASLH